jgi:hypothetical protein
MVMVLVEVNDGTVDMNCEWWRLELAEVLPVWVLVDWVLPW